jgi:hypothetical protein
MPGQSLTTLLLRMAVTAALLAALTQAVAASTKHKAPPCAALAKGIASLDSKMRAGYGGKAGEAMRDRQRAALDEFHRMKCRRL